MRLILQGLLLAMLQSAAEPTSCPDICRCVFDEILEENTGTCTIGNSTVNIKWSRMINQQILTIACQGTQFTCANLPQFDIQDNSAEVMVTNCASNITSCINDIYRSPSTVTTIHLLKLSGRYAPEDLGGFSEVHNLVMHLTENDKLLPAVVLNSMKTVQRVNILYGDLQLQANVFRQPTIRYLALVHNNIRNIPADAFNGLTNLKELSIEGSDIEEIHRDAFRGIDKLEDLYLSNLKMPSLDPEVFLTAENLTYLSLTETQLQYFPNGFLQRFKKLEMLQIKKNQIEMKLDSEAFARLPVSIHDIALFDCRIRDLPENLFMESSHIESLSIVDNMVEVLPPKIFSDLISLQTIGLMNNSIRMLSKDIFSKTENVKTINLSNNNIEILSGDVFSANRKVKYLFLHNNNISHVDINAFDGLKLIYLDLSCNKLKTISNNKTLSWNTRRLILSSNLLNHFENWFVHISRLTYLDLKHNQIKMIKESDIYSFESKAVVDLRNNKISKIIRDKSARKIIPKGHITLYLSNNPVECDCLVIIILNELNEYGILDDYEDIVCVNTGKLSNITNKELTLLCNKEQNLISLVGTCIIGTLIFIILIISVYRRRNKFLNYISTTLNRNTETLTPYELKRDSLKRYDLFISFAHQDGEFVTDELLTKLENEFGQKVCVHYRDWVVGDFIPDQIIQSVESSRMTAIILTEHFLESEWSYLEFRTAHNLSIQEGKPRVIIILLNENILQHENLCDDLKSYIAANTYLSWEDANFWTKFQNLLPRRGKMSPKKSKKDKMHDLLRCGC